MTGKLPKVSYKSDLIKLSVVKQGIKHSKVLYSQGQTGKGAKWNEIAIELQKKHQMNFRGTGVRDFLKEYLLTANREQLDHLIETGITENESGILSDRHDLKRCTLDLLDIMESIENEAQFKKDELGKKGKIEEELRLCATTGLNLSSDSISESKNNKNGRVTKQQLLKESTESIKQFGEDYITFEREKAVEEREHNAQLLGIQREQAVAAVQQAQASVKNADANLLAQQNLAVIISKL